MPRQSRFWTPERVAELTRLWEAGVKQVAIGAELGCPQTEISRKAKRLGLTRPPTSCTYDSATLALYAARLRAASARRIAEARAEREELNAAPLPPLPAPLREALERRARRER